MRMWSPIFILLAMNTVLVDFTNSTDITAWQIVNDGVMGGRSESRFSINDSGNGLFEGRISLENNGGFASVRRRFAPIDTKGYSKVSLRIKGDGKTYQFRIKATMEQRYSYVANVTSSGNWETVTIPFSDMYPAFRGRVLDGPNYSGATLYEIAFLIGNKKEESFALEIDHIVLR